METFMPHVSAHRAQVVTTEEPTSSGDQAVPGTPGTGENVCHACGGSGKLDGAPCVECDGTGKVTEGIGGG
jgi:DnaJ-class molecular chaperone